MTPLQPPLGSPGWALRAPDIPAPRWQLSPRACPSTPLAHQPTRPSSARLGCLAHRGRLSQLSEACLRPPRGMPAEAGPRAPSSARVAEPGAARHAATQGRPPDPLTHAPALPCLPQSCTAAPPSLQGIPPSLRGRQRAALPMTIPEATAVVTKGQLRPTETAAGRERAAGPPAARQQEPGSTIRANQPLAVKSPGLLGTQGHFPHKPITLDQGAQQIRLV